MSMAKQKEKYIFSESSGLISFHDRDGSKSQDKKDKFYKSRRRQ